MQEFMVNTHWQKIDEVFHKACFSSFNQDAEKENANVIGEMLLHKYVNILLFQR